MMSKRGYLLGALAVLLSIAGLKIWASGVWRGQGSAQPGPQAVASETPVGAPENQAQQGSQAAPPTMKVSKTDNPVNTGDQSLVSDLFSNSTVVDPQSAPKAVYLETIYDAGSIDSGTELSHAYKVKNTGKTDLLIESVKPG